MDAIKLAQSCYEDCRSLLLRDYPEIMSASAVGIAGDYSPCFGLNPWPGEKEAPLFTIWIADDVLGSRKDEASAALKAVAAKLGQAGEKRASCQGVKAFYKFYTGFGRTPGSRREWLDMAETGAACAVSGEVFEDFAGTFSATRQELLDFYPHDIFMEKLGQILVKASRLGQYEFPGLLRGNRSAEAFMAAGHFAREALAAVFLINKKYVPPLAMAVPLCANLAGPGPALAELARLLAAHGFHGAADLALAEMMEDFCAALASHLRTAGLSGVQGSWLLEHGEAMLEKSNIHPLAWKDLQ